MEGKLSKAESKVKLEYRHDGRNLTAVWEAVSGGIVETIYDDRGTVLKQVLLPSTPDSDKGLSCHMQRLAKEAKVESFKEGEFSDVKINKKCPTCGSNELEPHREKDLVPIVPTYICGKCGWRSYYLTDDYLAFLVQNNKGMLAKEELAELSADPVAFITELKEYIIRIFASKRIARIK